MGELASCGGTSNNLERMSTVLYESMQGKTNSIPLKMTNIISPQYRR